VAYRHLVEHPGFLAYFDQATPISEIERLPIGSRPSRRRERKSLSDLRAIPWTFAWTQSRQFIPAWYGLGTALLEDTRSRGEDWSLLQDIGGCGRQGRAGERSPCAAVQGRALPLSGSHRAS
jgi:phosphoenolpyruvate carboxylase